MRLTELDTDRTVVVKEVEGTTNMKMRLESMGIRPGVKVTKISSHFWKGPVTLKVGRAKMAIGHGMAKGIIVEE
ncbi:MAG: ferrous iron transport protein A [Candidatus Omnitrophica bacterium]|nr:ferrous iron transport protein A [Candidatus Omnitrophota bacterium]MBU1127918.1 ferrous iron transport protein A [Candidatus Omnitrophota bacterium]MBU1784309.1 ferrous iron transport protein A [Candidatus Omnitrophota bacterium]MBU1851601.1 ferrous iron transport protein A [Candidatus Omnitrophota bacterium]